MSCLTQVIVIANITGPVIHDTVSHIVGILIKVLDDPKNSDFSYYLFEALAVVISQANGHDQALISIFDTSLFPEVWRIIDDEILEFQPYAIQLLAQLANFRPAPLPEADKKVLGVLFSNAFWDRPPCVPALVALLRAYFCKFPNELHAEGMLNQILRLFSYRVREISSIDSAMKIINTLVETVSEAVMGQYMPSIWSVLFSQSCSRKAAEYLNAVGLFMSLVVERYGLSFLVTSNSINASSMLDCFIDICWIPNIKFVKGALKVKQTAVFSIKLLCSYQGLLADDAMWGKLLDTTITLLSHQDGAVEEQNDGAGLLQYSGNRGCDLLSYVDDPKAFLIRSLGTLSG